MVTGWPPVPPSPSWVLVSCTERQDRSYTRLEAVHRAEAVHPPTPRTVPRRPPWAMALHRPTTSITITWVDPMVIRHFENSGDISPTTKIIWRVSFFWAREGLEWSQGNYHLSACYQEFNGPENMVLPSGTFSRGAFSFSFGSSHFHFQESACQFHSIPRIRTISSIKTLSPAPPSTWSRGQIVWMITLTVWRMIYKAVHKLRSISAAGCVSADWNMRSDRSVRSSVNPISSRPCGFCFDIFRTSPWTGFFDWLSFLFFFLFSHFCFAF